jgi:hypothetical protein
LVCEQFCGRFERGDFKEVFRLLVKGDQRLNFLAGSLVGAGLIQECSTFFSRPLHDLLQQAIYSLPALRRHFIAFIQ